MVDNPIQLSQLLSPQEEIFAGLRPTRSYERRTWYTPNGISDRRYTVAEVAGAREERAFVLTNVPNFVLGGIVGFNLPSLSDRGRTTRDPVLLQGMIDRSVRGRHKLDGMDRTVLWEAVHGGKGSLHLRRASMNKYYPLQGKRRI